MKILIVLLFVLVIAQSIFTVYLFFTLENKVNIIDKKIVDSNNFLGDLTIYRDGIETTVKAKFELERKKTC